MEKVKLHTDIMTVGDGAFKNCTALKDITCEPSTAPTLGTDVFGGKAEHYVGSDVTGDKYLRILTNATGYTTGDWKTILQDKVGFIITEIS